MTLFEDFIVEGQDSKRATQILDEKILKESNLIQKRKDIGISPVPSLLDGQIPDKNLHLPLTEKTPAEAASSPSLYPVIHIENNDDWLDPAEEIDLEEEAAAYERERYDPPFVAPIQTREKRNSLQRLKWSQPPPYAPPEDSRTQPSAPPFPVNLPSQSPGIDDLLATKRSLTSQITQLRGVSLQKNLKTRLLRFRPYRSTC